MFNTVNEPKISFESKNYISCNVCKVVENIHPHRTCKLEYMHRFLVAGVWLHFDFIFVVLMRGNVTLNIAIGPFVRMKLQSRPSCGENRPVCVIP